MSKQVTKQTSKNKQVEILIQLFNEIHNNYVKKSVTLLNKILDIRKDQNPNYQIGDLEQEKGLEQHRDKIRPLLRFNTISDKTHEAYAQGKINSGTVMLMASLTQKLRTPRIQDKIVTAIKQGKLKNKDLIGREDLILEKIGLENTDAKENLLDLILLHIDQLIRRIEIGEDVLQQKEYYPQLVKKTNQLVKKVKGLR